MRKQVHLPIIVFLILTGSRDFYRFEKACVMLRAASNPLDLK